MASPIDDPFAINLEKMLIGSNFDSTLAFVFLMGVYTVVFLATLYSYFTRKNERNKIIVSTIIALYMVSLGQLFLQWYGMETNFNNYSSTRPTLLYALYGARPLVFESIFATVFQYIVYVLADSLLIWRCMKLHGHWSRILIIPILLFTVEIALTIAATTVGVLGYTGNEHEREYRGRQFEALDGALSITVAVTSLIVTLLICYRIHIRTKDVPRTTRRHRYKSTIRILVDSSMIYSLAVVCNSIMSLLNYETLDTFSAVLISVGGQFIDVFVFILSGLAPTIMVARIATYNDKERDEMSSIRLPSDLLPAPTQSIVTIPNSDNNTIEL